jgi:hypothetical protein
LRSGLPVFPVVLYLSPGAGGLTNEMYTETLLGETLLTFRYGVVGLPDLDSKPYLAGEEPVGWALSSAMQSGQQGRARHKFEVLRRLTEAAINEAQLGVLASVVETFLPLTRRGEAAEYQRIIADSNVQERGGTVINIFEERGEQRGLQKGLLQGQRALLTRMLQSKFGNLPTELEARLLAVSDPAQIELLSERILTARTLEEMGLSSLPLPQPTEN